MSENQVPRQSKGLLSQLVDPKMLGGSLKPAFSEVIKSYGSNLEGLWFHSARDLDFFIWRDENKAIIKQQLCFMGIVAEWNIIEGARTGVLSENERVEYDSKIQKVVLDQASQICSNILSLSQKEREDCARVWGEGPSVAAFLRHLVKAFLSIFKP